jgi:hypothetical protein
MSLKEQAQAVLNTIRLVGDKVSEIENLCMKVLEETKINGEVLSLSDEKKQKLIQAYQTKKGELKSLVEALP